MQPNDAAQLIGTSALPYQKEISWDQTYNDIYLLDVKTGKPKKVLEHWGNAATMSPAGKYVLHFDETTGHWLTYRVADGARVNLTEKDGGTLLTYNVEAQIGGKLAQLGQRLVNGAAKKLADDFFTKFAAAVKA